VAADSRLTHRVFGTPGSSRLVVLVGTGIAVAVDPLPAETARRDICVLAVALGAATMEDPGGYGGETPAEQTAEWLADLIRETLEETASETERSLPLTAGIVAYREAVDVALRTTAQLGETIDRLALVAVAAPAQPLDRDDLGSLIETVTARTLILNGQHDETAAAAGAAWYQSHIGSARAEMVPDETALSLPAVWARVLSHVAPRTQR
jgi:pimeloyl-ACP methyl ester carboxylesterase